MPTTERIPGYCALCVSRCGSIAVVEDGRFVALEPDPGHPTGGALCAKGRAAPELVYHRERLRHPLLRTRPKGDPDPGWKRISWDEALDRTAARLRELADESGPESVVFTIVSPSTSASADSVVWIERLQHAFGTPNACVSMELCGWGRFLATTYTFGDSVPGRYMPDLERAGCILFWGYNPNLARLSHAVGTAAAVKRGARLLVVDPRRVGPAARADVWLRVRPGTDAALALGLTHVLIERGWYDAAFVREWTNGPFLVRSDTGRLLHDAGALPQGTDPPLRGEVRVETPDGVVTCRPAFDLVAEECSRYPPERVEAICGIPAAQVEEAARLLWEARPVAYYAWSGVEMQTGSTQIARAIAQLHALTGSLDVPGGNVLFAAPPAVDCTGRDLPGARRAPALGVAERPLGPARWQFVTSDDVYRAILERRPYPVRGIVGFGSNLLLSHADGDRGREALAALDFYVHADLFMNPTAALADIVLPVASAFEREALKIGFETSPDAQALVQLRRPVVEPQGEARSDTEIVFDLAVRLGLGGDFWDGDIDTAWRAQLAPSGITLDALRAQPAGIRLPLETRHRKFAEPGPGGAPRGFRTPSGRVELFSETLAEHGYPPVPTYDEPLVGPVSRPDLLARFPLVLTSAKHTLFCESQHRAIPALRRRAPDPELEIHPAAAADRRIRSGDWVWLETPAGRVRARAALNPSLAPSVVCGQHGWWQACAEVDAPAYDPFSDDGANFNRAIANDAVDPISGSVPHRAYLCEVRPVDPR